MNLVTLGALTIFGMFAATMCLLEIGRRIGKRRLAKDPDGAKAISGAVEGAVFGLMGLLIAFTFSGAASRLDTRRAQLIEEANCIGTAWLRLDLLPAEAQPALREKLRQYTDARLAAFRAAPDYAATKVELDRAVRLQNDIWKQAITAGNRSPSSTMPMLLLPALNQMFDMASTRNITARLHPPPMIYGMLALLVLAGALLTGYDLGVGKSRNWFHALAFVLVISISIYVILDFEFPRVGLIQIHHLDQVLVDLRQSMD